MDKFKSLQSFVTTAESGSFSSASRKLGVTPQQIAKYITNLEEQLNLRLITRTTRQQSLTEFGQQYYERCKKILYEIKEADRMASDIITSPKGKIRISAPYNFGSYNLIPFLKNYMQTYPDIKIELSLSDRFVDIIDEEFDIIFRIGDPLITKSATLVCRRLQPLTLLVCASPSYISRNGMPQTLDDLSKHQCLGYLFWDGTTDKTWEFNTKEGNIKVPINSTFYVNNIQAKVNAAIMGLGITLCSEEMAKPYLKRGELISLLTHYIPQSRPISLIYPSNHSSSAKMRTFISTAIKYLG